MNTLLAKTIQQKLDEINTTSEHNIRDKMNSILTDLFDIDGKNINTQGGWSGDIHIKFKSLTLSNTLKLNSSDEVEIVPEKNEVNISYLDDKDNCKLIFSPNRDSTKKSMSYKWGQNINNFESQRHFLELIATIVYMRDNKIRGYAWLPEFEEKVRELLDNYEIYPKYIEFYDMDSK